MAQKNNENTIIVIPSLHPSIELIDYVDELSKYNFKDIIVVDDGSGSKYKNIFNSLKARVLTHDINKGKGEALKTAFKFILDSYGKADYCVITADSDGQHKVNDVISIAEMANKHKDSLVLGTRDFNEKNVPFKSRFGNKTTSIVFRLLYGKYIPDTQTGLRGFSSSFLEKLIKIKGSRFEYEMNMLIELSICKTPFIYSTIETVYKDNNNHTHFNPIKDSLKIYKVIFANFFIFLTSSLSAMLVDNLSFIVISKLILNYIDIKNTSRILIAGYIARFISSLFNFIVNKNLVFKNKRKTNALIFKYYLVVILNITLSSLIVAFFHNTFNKNEYIIKPIVDSLLFFLSYKLQRFWVFKDND